MDSGPRNPSQTLARQLARLALLVASLVVLWPAPARAAISNECAAELASHEPGDDGASLCGEGTLLVRRISHLEVPICLIEGASAVAPLPLIPTDGARAESNDDCHSLDLPSELTRGHDPSQSKAPLGPPLAAIVSLPELPGPLPLAAHLLPRRGTTVLGRAHRSGVYRPPRG